MDKARITATQFVKWRTALGVTQEEAAHILSVPLATYKNWEYGVRHPTALSCIGLRLLMGAAKA